MEELYDVMAIRFNQRTRKKGGVPGTDALQESQLRAFQENRKGE